MSKSVVDILVFVLKLTIDFAITVIVALPLLIIELIYLILPRRKKNIAGQLVVITGGGNGLGKGMAYELGREGCKIVIVDIDLNAAEKTCAGLKEKEVECKAYKVDISSYEQVEQLSNEIENDFGQVDILINNAGVILFGYLHDAKIQDLSRLIRVNVDSHVWMCKIFLEKMIKNQKGHIVATSSIQGIYSHPYAAAYAMSKFAVTGLMSSICEQIRVQKLSNSIKTSIISPYYINTTSEVAELSSKYRFPMLSIEETASAAVDGILREKQLIDIPYGMGFMIKFMLIFPLPVQQVIRKYIVGEN